MRTGDMIDLIPFDSSPFEAIKRVNETGEHWTGRDLMPVMDYANWREFAAVIEKAKASLALVQGAEAAEHHLVMSPSDGGRWGNQQIDDYRLTRFAAYLVAMAGEHTKKAVAEARVYFAVKTREAEVAKPVHEMDELEVAERYVAALRAKKELERQVAELEPKAEAHDAYMSADGVFLVRAVAKTLGVKESVLRRHCYDHRILMSHPARRNEPYAEHVTAGYFEVKHRPVKVSEEETRAFPTTFVTPSGVEFLRRSLERAGVIEPRPRLALVRSGGVA